MDSAFGYGMPPVSKKAPVRVVMSGAPIQRQYPGGEDSYITTDMPSPPMVGDKVEFNFDAIQPLTVLYRRWVYEPDIKKWHLECRVG